LGNLKRRNDLGELGEDGGYYSRRRRETEYVGVYRIQLPLDFLNTTICLPVAVKLLIS
jgi:hypothetical protein